MGQREVLTVHTFFRPVMSRTNIFAYILNRCSVQYLQDDGDIMELSNVFYKEKFSFSCGYY